MSSEESSLGKLKEFLDLLSKYPVAIKICLPLLCVIAFFFLIILGKIAFSIGGNQQFNFSVDKFGWIQSDSASNNSFDTHRFHSIKSLEELQNKLTDEKFGSVKYEEKISVKIGEISLPEREDFHTETFVYKVNEANIEWNDRYVRIILEMVNYPESDEEDIHKELLIGEGEIRNGVAVVKYHGWSIGTKKYNWYGSFVLEVPSTGPANGYWLTSHEFEKGGPFAMGYIDFNRHKFRDK